MAKPKLPNGDGVVAIDQRPRFAMGAMLFLAGFLATGFMAAKTLASFEIEPAERVGAEAFLFLLCATASAISILSYLQGSRRFQRCPGRIAALAGGAAAAGISSAALGTIYHGFGFTFAVTLALMLPASLRSPGRYSPRTPQAIEKGHSSGPSQPPGLARARKPLAPNPPLAKFVISYNQFTKPLR